MCCEREVIEIGFAEEVEIGSEKAAAELEICSEITGTLNENNLDENNEERG